MEYALWITSKTTVFEEFKKKKKNSFSSSYSLNNVAVAFPSLPSSAAWLLGACYLCCGFTPKNKEQKSQRCGIRRKTQRNSSSEQIPVTPEYSLSCFTTAAQKSSQINIVLKAFFFSFLFFFMDILKSKEIKCSSVVSTANDSLLQLISDCLTVFQK